MHLASAAALVTLLHFPATFMFLQYTKQTHIMLSRSPLTNALRFWQVLHCRVYEPSIGTATKSTMSQPSHAARNLIESRLIFMLSVVERYLPGVAGGYGLDACHAAQRGWHTHRCDSFE
jgi:hypothetical protein